MKTGTRCARIGLALLATAGTLAVFSVACKARPPIPTATPRPATTPAVVTATPVASMGRAPGWAARVPNELARTMFGVGVGISLADDIAVATADAIRRAREQLSGRLQPAVRLATADFSALGPTIAAGKPTDLETLQAALQAHIPDLVAQAATVRRVFVSPRYPDGVAHVFVLVGLDFDHAAGFFARLLGPRSATQPAMEPHSGGAFASSPVVHSHSHSHSHDLRIWLVKMQKSAFGADSRLVPPPIPGERAFTGTAE